MPRSLDINPFSVQNSLQCYVMRGKRLVNESRRAQTAVWAERDKPATFDPHPAALSLVTEPLDKP
jgi:hypothetical protein